MWGLFGGLGALVALWIGLMVMRVSGVLVLVVVAMFLAVGLNPAVEFLIRRGMKRPYAVLCVISCVVLVFVGFLTLLVPIISHQVSEISNSLPGWFDKLQRNKDIRDFDQKYDDHLQGRGLREVGHLGREGVRRRGRRRSGHPRASC